MRKIIFLLLLSMMPWVVSAQTGCNAGRAFVSGYFSNVHVYNACTGAFERVLDSSGRINGAQAVWARPDGMLYVVSENNARILRYRTSTLEFVDTFIDTGPSFAPTGIAFAPDGDVYVAGYQSDSVRRYDGQSGALEATPIPSGAGGLDGPDNGMTFGPDGLLYIPGYDSNNVLRFNPNTNVLSTFVAAGAGGLRRTRAILFEPGNASVLVSSEGSDQILRFNAANGALIGTFANLSRPAGMNYTNDGRLLVATNSNLISVLNASNGAVIGPLFPLAGGGGLQGSTYVAVVPPTLDVAQVGSQYWIAGASQINGRIIEMEMTSATGTQFGAGFNAQSIVRKRWGRIRIEFTACDTANFSWDSTGSDSASFGSGTYPVQLLLGSAYSDSCRATPFNEVSGGNFMNGVWYGGAARSGEGLFVTVNASGLASVAMFTHRPAGL